MKKVEISDSELHRYNRRTWLAMAKFAILSGLAYTGWRWLRKQPPDGGLLGGIPEPLRNGLHANEKLFSSYYSNTRLVKEYPKSLAAKEVRVNSKIGLDEMYAKTNSWSLTVQKTGGSTLEVKLSEITSLPKTEVIFNFKCIEGWSQISWWGGVRFSDFIKHFSLEKEIESNFVGMSTPDTEYSIGIDMASALHPQTILAYEMNGQPLVLEHGAPLRLIIPVKYGYKSLKQIGSIYFDNAKPSDYWAIRGYDYYAGL